MTPDVYPNEYEPLYAVRVDEATIAKARAAVRREYGPFEHPLRYLGIRVVNLPPDDEHIGPRRRVHVFTDEPA